MEEKKIDYAIKSIRLDNETISVIEKMARETERDFSGQVRWMLKEYIRIKEERK